ncbi:hypothetical protein FRC12_011254 [Ceratobasidium sp. 428]|nr:hypothetical protein FRC12_011254 [Ceratobasidium sp. 428]
MDTPFPHDMNLEEVKQILKSMLVDYKTSPLGGLSQDMVVACLDNLVPNIQARFAHLEHLDVWAPKVQEGPSDPTFSLVKEDVLMDVASLEADPQTLEQDLQDLASKILWILEALTHADQLQLHEAQKLPKSDSLKYKCGSQKVAHLHWSSLQQKHWVSSGLLNFLCSSATSPENGLWCLSTAFMPQLKEPYQQVSQLCPFGWVNKTPVSILDGVKCVSVPFNEPIICMNQMPSAAVPACNHQSGSHWAALIIHPQLQKVVYKSSLLQRKAAEDAINLIKVYLNGLRAHRKSDKGKFKEQAWSFMIQEVCRICIVACHRLDIAEPFDRIYPSSPITLTEGCTHIETLQQCLSVQILKGDVKLSTLIEQTTSEAVQLPEMNVVQTPNHKRHQSQTPTTSPEVILKQKQALRVPNVTTGAHRVKQLKLAAFPIKAPLLVPMGRTDKSRTLPDSSHMDRIMDFTPTSTSSSPDEEMSEDTDHWQDAPWPTAINGNTLSQRIKQLLPHLTGVCTSPSTSYPYQVAKDFWTRHKRSYAVDAQGMHEVDKQIGLS